MKDKLTQHWIVIGIIWTGVLAMTYVNLQAIEQIKTRMQSLESSHLQEAFLKRHLDKIAQVRKQRASLYKTIDSDQIEMITLTRALDEATQMQGLSEFRLVNDQTAMQADRIALEIGVTGRYGDLVQWLQEVETHTPFLIVTHVQVETNKNGEGYRFLVSIIFRFTIDGEAHDSA
jgi:Tfp pilus assembly protein PilO